MADYFSEYSSFVGAKGLPSPADTPYETPNFIRSKRNSRVTNASSREHSSSPPPLPPDTTDAAEKTRDGRYTALDPRRFTPTLHASLVSEILNLRRELDTKNSLVENLETSLSTSRNDNDALERKLSEHARDVRKAKQQVQQMESGAYSAVEELARERQAALVALEDMRVKLDGAQKKVRQQDEDAVRTQSIWEQDKESWDSERRQLERRVHVTETRLRTVVDEMTSQQNNATIAEDFIEDGTFKDSGFGNDSDTASIRSASPVKHKRNASSISYRARNTRASVASRTTLGTPDLYATRQGNTLADELGIDEEDEYDLADSENGDAELDLHEQARRAMESRHGSVTGELDAKAKRVLGLVTAMHEQQQQQQQPAAKDPLTTSHEAQERQGSSKNYQDRATIPPTTAPQMRDPESRVLYVDTGYQPSPPSSPPRVEVTHVSDDIAHNNEEASDNKHLPGIGIDALQRPHEVQAKPISPPQTPVIEGVVWTSEKTSSSVVREYSTASTQTDLVAPEKTKEHGHTPKRDSLSPPMFVPSIAIHPPSSRPSSPRSYVLPPGTKNATSQANLVWPGRDACVQTEEIRIDRRTMKLPMHLQPGALLPSPTFQESSVPKPDRTSKRLSNRPPAISIPASPPLHSPVASSPEMSRDNSSKDLRSYPLKAIPLPRPVLSPPLPITETATSNGPLNRSSQYGVTQARSNDRPHEADQLSVSSDSDIDMEEADAGYFSAPFQNFSRPPPGRFGLSEPPKAVPEDKEISPERRPDTADSYGAAPAPSISSSRPPSQNRHARPLAKLVKPTVASKDIRNRSDSLGSIVSSSLSAQSSMPLPPYPVPMRISSRQKPHSEGSTSPTQYDGFSRGGRYARSHNRQSSLRKVQSASVMRNRTGRGSPNKHRRRRRSPDLTPVQSMAFDSPGPTQFPIPDLPTPLQRGNSTFNLANGSVDLKGSPDKTSTMGRTSEETNLVDAIAGTMVGEWMWKYIRKRKSFGIGEDTTSEFPVNDQNGMMNISAHGTRHKRWVWLSPYERTIMWDTKQPNSGAALLGKKGRKLAIQSVLDVQDNTPMPKNPELSAAWNRSILILTPERALKFTATTEERHGLWMTALAFLAQSSSLPTQIPPMPTSKPPLPPMPSIDGVPIKRHRSPSFGRTNVRDSIRLAKGRRPEHLQNISSQPEPPYGADVTDAEPGAENSGADFPAVPRLYIATTKHQRKRSSTNPGQPQALTNFRSFSSSIGPSSASSAMHYKSTNGSSFRPSVSSKSGSYRESVASPIQPNFFEAVGTVRMEAFVDPNVRDGVLYVPAPPPIIGAPRRPRRGSNLSQSTVDKRRAGYVFDEEGLDPFKGF